MFKTKRFFSFMLILIGMLLLVACNPTEIDPNPDPDPDPDPVPGETGVITWTGLEDLLVASGDRVDLMEGIQVTDTVDNDITSSVFILNDSDHEDILDENGWLDDFFEFNPHMEDNYKVYYGVSNSTGVTEYKERNVSVRQQHNIRNNDFSMDGYGWGFGMPGGAATVEYVNNQAVYNITNSGTEWWAIQHESNIRLIEGETYKLTLTASSPDNRSIALGFEDINNGYAMLFSTTTHILTDELETYTLYYTANANYNNIKAVIYLGNMHENDVIPHGESHTVILDSVYIEKVNLNTDVEFTGQTGRKNLNSGQFSLTEGGDLPFEDLSSYVTASLDGESIDDRVKVSGTISENVQGNTTYAIQYIVEFEDGSVAFARKEVRVELVREFPHSTINGHFNSGFAGWTPDINQTDGNGQADFIDNADGTISIQMGANSGAAWHMQLFQAGISLKDGVTYKISMRAKASSVQEGTIEVVNPSAGFAAVLKPARPVELGEEWTLIEIEFTSDANYSGLRLGFQFGRMSRDTKIDIDYFLIDIVEPAQD